MEKILNNNNDGKPTLGRSYFMTKKDLFQEQKVDLGLKKSINRTYQIHQWDREVGVSLQSSPRIQKDAYILIYT